MEAELVEVFGREDHLRQRIAPRPGDEYFLPLKDLLRAQNFSHNRSELILDFGAGNSPYASFFPNAEYRRADILPVPGLTYSIRNDGTIDEQENTFDLVLSTQVLEHIEDPERYLREAFRVLRPGGRLLLSTHGVWEDHGCPYDFQRWTADGLQSEIRRAGFRIEKCLKLTTQMRFLTFLALRLFPGCRFLYFRAPFGVHSIILEMIRRYFRRCRCGIDLFIDKLSETQAVVDGSNPEAVLYLGVLVAASKPE